MVLEGDKIASLGGSGSAVLNVKCLLFAPSTLNFQPSSLWDSATYIPTLQQFCKEVLEPLRKYVGGPIVISSGYRCNQLNVKVGGAYASQHTLGEAADIRLPLTSYTAWDDNKRHTDLETARKWFDWIEHNCDFDQLILETSNGKDFWIHVSCRKNRRANRHQVIRYLKK